MIFIYYSEKKNNEGKEKYVLVYGITVGYSWEAKMPTQLSVFNKHYY